MLLTPATLSGTLHRQSSKEMNLEARLLSRLLENERQNMAAPEETELPEERGGEKETVFKAENQGNIIDIKVGNKLIEQHLQDCKQRYEMIVLNDDGGTNVRQSACYMHKMEDKFYDFAGEGKGERPYQTYFIGKEIANKEVLPENGPMSICRSRPLFSLMPANDLDQDNSPSIRGFEKSKRCLVKCCKKVRGVCVWWCIC